jgi:hypothetical protein
LPKETNQRKGSQSLCLPSADCPALLKITGRCETRPPEADSDSPRAFPVIFLLLGCVKWPQNVHIAIGYWFQEIKEQYMLPILKKT